MIKTVTIHHKKFNIYIEKDIIHQRVSAIASQINEEFKDKNPIFLIVLRGAFMFASDILKQIRIDSEIDFIKLSSYDGMHTSGKIILDSAPKIDLMNRNVIIIEDIVDSGLTMQFLFDYLNKKQVASCALVTLLHKPDNTQVSVKIDYCGFQIPNLFVVGYGLDYNEHGRNLEAIYQIEV